VRELNKSLKEHGISSGEIHGDMDQPARVAELEKFKRGEVDILVASDVAARGLDVKGVSHVFNYDAPWHPDDYVHRIGRTGRGGATGIAYTFVGPDDVENIENIEKLTGQKIPRIDTLPEPQATAEEAAPARRERTPRGEKRRTRGGDEQVAAAPARDETPAAAPRRARSERVAEEQPRRERGERAAAEQPRHERVAEEQPRRERTRRSREDTPVREAPRAVAATSVAQVDDGSWNGPIPDFLKVRLTA
jgi:superfamily II DNA/RNA helicase